MERKKIRAVLQERLPYYLAGAVCVAVVIGEVVILALLSPRVLLLGMAIVAVALLALFIVWIIGNAGSGDGRRGDSL